MEKIAQPLSSIYNLVIVLGVVAALTSQTVAKIACCIAEVSFNKASSFFGNLCDLTTLSFMCMPLNKWNIS